MTRWRALAVLLCAAVFALAHSPAAHAVLLAQSSCPPALAAPAGLTEGTTSPPSGLPTVGRISAVMLFVDFPRLRGSEAPRMLFGRLVPRARAWYDAVSYGRLQLDVTPVFRWLRMPHRLPTYGLADGVTWEEHSRYIGDAVAAADSRVDFSRFQVAYVVAPRGSKIERSPAFIALPGTGIEADGAEIRAAATFFDDTRVDARFAANVLIHETGHLLGLPDLYDVPRAVYWSLLRFAGGWDIMSWNEPGASFFAWEKWKLGWVDASQLACLNGAGSVTETVTPLERAGGTKAVVVPVSPSAAYVVEARRRVGVDSRLCKSGVLVYLVDASVASGFGPVRVSPAQPDVGTAMRDRCGPLFNAPFEAGTARFQDLAAGITMQVLASDADGYRIRVTEMPFHSDWVAINPVVGAVPGPVVTDGSAPEPAPKAGAA